MARTCARGAIWACISAIAILICRLCAVGISLWMASPILPTAELPLSILTWCLVCAALDAARVPFRVRVLLRLLDASSGEQIDVTDNSMPSSDPQAWLSRAAREKRQRFVQEFQYGCHAVVLPDAAVASMTTPADVIVTIIAGAWMCPIGLALIGPQAVNILDPSTSSIGSFHAEAALLAALALSLCLFATARLFCAASFSSIRCAQDGCRRRDAVACLFCCCFRTLRQSGTAQGGPSAIGGGGSTTVDGSAPSPDDDGEADYVLAMAEMEAAQASRLPRVRRPVPPVVAGLSAAQLAACPSLTLADALMRVSPRETVASGAAVALDRAHAMCSMCLAAIGPSDPVRVLQPCGHHEYHRDCIDAWLLRKAECPVCRARVGSMAQPPAVGAAVVPGSHPLEAAEASAALPDAVAVDSVVIVVQATPPQ